MRKCDFKWMFYKFAAYFPEHLLKCSNVNNAQTCMDQFVLIIKCLGRQFGINCPSAFLKILKEPQ